jgi:biopolymer transport protein ExbB/TolQ
MDKTLSFTPDSLLSWHRQDPEARLGLRAGRYTEVNTWFSCLLSLVATVVFFGGLKLAHLGHIITDSNHLYRMFLGHWYISLPITFFFCWSAIILILKSSKLKLQRKALTLAVLPQDANYVLTAQTAAAALQRVETLADSPAQFVLLNRLKLALSNLQNLGLVSEMVAMLESQSEADEQHAANSYQLVAGFIWAMPVLGFIGTVWGLSLSINEFGQKLDQLNNTDAIQGALKGVVSGLSVSFDTTMMGLVAAVFLQLASTIMRRREARFLNDCKEYCQRYVIGRLRLK